MHEIETLLGQLPSILYALAGILLLLAGRRLYWLFVGLVGFLVGYSFAGQWVDLGPEWSDLALGVFAGMAASFFAVLFKKVAVGIAGFVAGAYVAFWVLQGWGWDQGPLLWLMVIAAGIVGAILVKLLFELALILLSSLLGASLLLDLAGGEWASGGWPFLALAGFGALVQAFAGRRRKKEPER